MLIVGAVMMVIGVEAVSPPLTTLRVRPRRRRTADGEGAGAGAGSVDRHRAGPCVTGSAELSHSEAVPVPAPVKLLP